MATKTTLATPATVNPEWLHIDATDLVVGRLAVQISTILRGKHRPTFTPHMDGGDFVVVVNAANIRLTGRKLEQKRYFSHSGYMGHESFTPVKEVLAADPVDQVRPADVVVEQEATDVGHDVLERDAVL